jgi:hypothetical protein
VQGCDETTARRKHRPGEIEEVQEVRVSVDGGELFRDDSARAGAWVAQPLPDEEDVEVRRLHAVGTRRGRHELEPKILLRRREPVERPQ